MATDTPSLAGRIARALVQVLATADWSDGLAAKVAQILEGEHPAGPESIASLLGRSQDAIMRAGSRQHEEEIRAEVYDQWRRRLDRLLSADPDPSWRAGRVLLLLQRAAGGTGHAVTRGPGGVRRTDTRHRRLRCACPDAVRVGEDFGVIIRIAVAGEGARLKSFPVPPGGQDVLLDIKARGLLTRGPYQQRVRVPPDGLKLARFELRADQPGPAAISVTAWLDGSFLGEVEASVTAYRDAVSPGRDRETGSELTAETADGAVSLLIRYEPADSLYRFQFMAPGNPPEQRVHLLRPPHELIRELVSELEARTLDEAWDSVAAVRGFLKNAGAKLWRDLVPAPVREQYWDLHAGIRQLRILSDKDAMPWELLYPLDPGRDKGFLVEQEFPVTRDIFGRPPGRPRVLYPHPARFVLPPDSPPAAIREVEFLRGLLDDGPHRAVLHRPSQVTSLINEGGFGLLHFACHNNFREGPGSLIDLGGSRFTPTDLETATINHALRESAPLVFLNACRSAGAAFGYSGLDGWAESFLRAGAGAFIGSLWAVNDFHAFTFAEHLYSLLKDGRQTLGEATSQARRALAARGGYPTCLAYSVYGDPLARFG